jgi:hypothetical protein
MHISPFRRPIKKFFILSMEDVSLSVQIAAIEAAAATAATATTGSVSSGKKGKLSFKFEC